MGARGRIARRGASRAKMAMAVASRCCSANEEEQRGKWSGAVFRRERRSVCLHLRHPRERRAQSGGEEGAGGSRRGGDVQSGATGAREAKRRRRPLEEGAARSNYTWETEPSSPGIGDETQQS